MPCGFLLQSWAELSASQSPSDFSESAAGEEEKMDEGG
jgi:hypothetical protein